MKVFGGNGGSRGNQQNNMANNSESSKIRDGHDVNNNKKSVAPQPRKKHRGRGWLIALLAVVAIVGSAFAYLEIIAKPPKKDPVPDISGEDAAATVDEERYYTLLLVGDDQQQGNTDTIMLLRFDTVELKVNAVSIPRDIMVNVPWHNKKINTIYHWAEDGIESLIDEIENISGIRPNNYVVVDTDIFVEVVDALGGVDFYVPFDMNYDDVAPGREYKFSIHVDEGQQTLSGYDALGVFRWRKNNFGQGHVYANPDIERIGLQHKLLLAIAEKAMSARDPGTLFKIAEAVWGSYETDLEFDNIYWYIRKFFDMSMDNVQFFTMPTTGVWVGDNACLTIDVDPWLEMINENFNTSSKEIKREDCTIVYLSVPKQLVGGQLYANLDEFATTDGTEFNR